MEYDNPALVRLLISNIIGYLAATYSDEHDMPLSESVQCVMDSTLYKKLIDPETALYCESIPLLYEQIATM
jgi:hypothetical protein